jgi:hypothetical protein
MEIPNLSGLADPKNVSQKGTGRFTADYINWARTLQDIRSQAPGWMPELMEDVDGRELHKAPDGSAYLMIRFRHTDGTETTAIPHAIMDHKMMPVAGDKIGARDVADSFVRGACKAAAALFGYAWQMWSKDDPMARDIMHEPTEHVTERKIVKEGMIKQSTDEAYEKVEWPGKKYTKMQLGEIAKKDPEYLKEILKQKFEVIKDQDPNLLKAIEYVVGKMSNNGKQDFPDAK